VRCFGVPDRFFDHGTRDALLRMAGLTPDALAVELERWLRGTARSTPEPLAPVGTGA
jgi:deoxyxylulose-5-phosphate synthase